LTLAEFVKRKLSVNARSGSAKIVPLVTIDGATTTSYGNNVMASPTFKNDLDVAMLERASEANVNTPYTNHEAFQSSTV
jgi:hypothetical protein